VSHPPKWLDGLAEEYKKKLNFWITTEIKTLMPSRFDRASKDRKKDEESESLLQAIKPDDFVLLCDEQGKSLDSRDFSRLLEKVMGSGKKRFVFVIGGAYGVNDLLKTRANLTLSLSPLTLNHYIASSLLLEQVYRGMTILKGVKYHNDETV
jgi:23S rRNA (pseudouridine1915-N3)-methyltransferase